MPKHLIDFKAVKAAVSMEQLLQHYGLIDRFKRSANGDNLAGTCPLHNGTNPTQFRISLSKNCWNCFGDCQTGGNVLDFVARKEGVGLRDAAAKLCEWFGLPVGKPEDKRNNTRRPFPPRKPAPEKDRTEKQPPSDASSAEPESGVNKPLGFQLPHLDASHPYLVERGLTPETVAEFGLGFCAKGVMAGRIAIPIHNAEGQIVAYAGRWPGNPPDETPKYKLPAGFKKSLEIFNLHRAIKELDEQPLVIVEGFFDCIKLWQHGCRKVVALMGSELSAAQEALLRQHVNAQSRVLVMLDEDDAGRAGREDIASRLAKVCFVRVQQFEQAGTQPEHLSAERIERLIGGVR